MNIEETVDFHLRSSLFAMRRMYNLLAAENGLTQGIGYTLINIGKEGVPATKIAPMMGMSSSSLSRLLKTMEQQGLLYRKVDDGDRRVVKIHLTEEGRKLREAVKAVVVSFNNTLLKKIKKSDWDAFVRVNQTIRDQVEQDVDAFHLK